MVERNQAHSASLTEHSRKPVTRRFPSEAVTLYKKINMAIPMAPMVDVTIWHELLTQVRSGLWSMHDFARAQLSHAQIADVGKATTIIHANKHIPFIVKGQHEAVPPEKWEPLRTMAAKLLDSGMPPHRQNAYVYDEKKGVFLIYPFSFVRGMNGIRKRTYTGVLHFMRGVGAHNPTKEAPINRGVVNPGNSERIQRFLTDPRWYRESGQLMDLLGAARTVINPHTLSELAQKQAGHYDLGRGGRMGYRATPQLLHLVGHIRNAISDTWDALPPENRVPASAKDRLLYDMIDTVLPSPNP